MNRSFSTLTAIVLPVAVLLAQPALANDPGDLTFGAGLTTLGPMVEGTYTINESFAVRSMVIGGVSLSDVIDVDDYTVDGTLTLGGVGVMADYYPTRFGWRLSAGLFSSFSSLEGAFVGPETFDAEATFDNTIAPMVTTGYRHTFGSGWAVSADLGLIVTSVSVASDETLPAVVAEIDRLNDTLSDVPVVPYLGLGVSFQF